MTRFLTVLSFTLIYFPQVLLADEGMWLPSMIEKLNINQMKKEGLSLEAQDIYNINQSSLKDAIVSLDRGSCTGEIISDQGLLLTNHHCGFDEIQEHSTLENDYLKNGFWAKSPEEELPNPNKSATFLIRCEEVTQEIVPFLSDTMTAAERTTKERELSSKIEHRAVANSHYQARVQALYNNNRYYLFVTETFRDVRLVGTPPQSLGKFGGDTDNWMWPRHTADFCMFRIYCCSTGNRASNSNDHLPYKPRKIPKKHSNEKLRIMEQFMLSSRKANLMYSSKYAISSNYYKYSIGQNEGLRKLNVPENKKNLESAFTRWVDEDHGRKAKYGDALNLISGAYKDLSDEIAAEYMLEAILGGPEIFNFPYRTHQLYDNLKAGKKNERIKTHNDPFNNR